MKNKIEDFGERIEGARKDIAALRKGIMSLTASMANSWNDEEREKYITKDLVWKKPDYQQMYAEGTDRKLLYYIKTIRDALPAKPSSSIKEYQNGYIEFVSHVRDRAMKMKDLSDIESFKEEIIGKYLEKRSSHSYVYKVNTYGCFQNKLLKAILRKPTDVDVKRKEFLYTEDEKLRDEYIKAVVHYKPYQDLYVDWTTRANGKEEATIKIQSDIMSWAIYVVPNLDKNVKRTDFKQNTYFVIAKNGELVGMNYPTEEEATKKALEYAREHSDTSNKSKKPSANRKTKLLPPQLEHIQRNGFEYRENDKDVAGEDILKKFGLRGGQFGNWTNQKDRQASMNMLYDAFCDLAVALDIPYEDIALIRSNAERTSALGIAFGARGHSSALAHFESAENVINLTKMKGAGSLAHEWGHALDCYIKKELGLINAYCANTKQKQLATHCYENNNPTADVVDVMSRKKDSHGYVIPTQYKEDSRKADNNYSKSDNGYWSSNCEMFARAFACYVKDKLEEKGIRSDYLCGHSEATIKPKGEERKVINNAFDAFFADLKNRGLLRHQVHDVKSEQKSVSPKKETKKVSISDFVNEKAEQLSLFDTVMEGEDSESFPEAKCGNFIDGLTFEFKSVTRISDGEELVITLKANESLEEITTRYGNEISQKACFEGDESLASICLEITEDELELFILQEDGERYYIPLSDKDKTTVVQKAENSLGHSIDEEFEKAETMFYEENENEENVEYDNF